MNDAPKFQDVNQAAALRGEPEAVGHGSVEGDVRALRQMIADCDVYLKEGETPAQRIERERRDTEAVLNLLIREKQRTEAMREVMLRMMAGIDHLAEIARQWEPDYSSGADRRGWVLAEDARDDAARLIAEPPQAASGFSRSARSDGPITKFGIKPHSTLAQLKDDEDLRLYVQAHIEEARSAEQGATPPAPAALPAGWLPIEKAPKDGSLFLCWVMAIIYGETDEGQQYQQDVSQIDFCQWHAHDEAPDGGWFEPCCGHISDRQDVTHWMPLPEPPPAAPGGPAGALRQDEQSRSGPSDRASNQQPEAVDCDRGAR